jgi:hypothetical protein
MVSPARFERATYALGGHRAIQLRHGDLLRNCISWFSFLGSNNRILQANCA